MATMAYLTDMVKYCVLDKACMDGKYADDCIGTISVNVVYEDQIIPVTTEITSDDILKFEEIKQLQFPH